MRIHALANGARGRGGPRPAQIQFGRSRVVPAKKVSEERSFGFGVF